MKQKPNSSNDINNKPYIYFIACLFLIPQSAFGNSVTPLVFRESLHLFIGNIAIGMIEGLIIIRFFMTENKLRTILICILANYISMILGLILWTDFLSKIILSLYFPPLFYVIPIILTTYLVFLLLTILIEWPFCFFVLSKASPSKTLKTALLASILINICSYLLIAAFYYSESNFNLAYDVTIEKDLTFVKEPLAEIYYIDGNRNLCSIKSNGQGYRKLLNLTSKNSSSRLWIKRNRDNWQLVIKGKSKEKVLIDKFLKRNSPFATLLSKKFLREQKHLQSEMELFYNQLIPLDFREDKHRTWTFNAQFRDYNGATISENQKKKYAFAFDLPLLNWRIKNAYILPGEQVLFLLGNQIVILNMPQCKLGYLATGSDFVVVLLKRN